jgi:drug/metabolite transporter (DMT)-like permease
LLRELFFTRHALDRRSREIKARHGVAVKIAQFARVSPSRVIENSCCDDFPFDLKRKSLAELRHESRARHVKTLWTKNAEAIAWVATSTAIFSFIFASGKFAGDTASVFQINFLRQVGGFLTLAAIVAIGRDSLPSYRSKRPLAHFMRAICGVCGALAVIQASADMPIVDATAMSLLYVVFVVILGMLFFHERIGKRQWAGILICGGGAFAIMVSRGAFQHFDLGYIRPALLAMSGAALFALEGILIKVLSQSDRPMIVLVHVNIFGLLMLTAPALFAWKPLPLTDTLGYMLLGPLGIAAQYCTIRGYRMANLSVVGPVDYSWLVFAAVIGFVFFNEVPTSGVFLGAALITAGGIVLATVRPAPEKQAMPELQ